MPVDPDNERVHPVRRTGWTDDRLDLGADVMLRLLDLLVPHAEIFARD